MNLPASCERITYLYRVRACEGSLCSPWSGYDASVELVSGTPTLTSTIGIAYYHTDALGSPVVQTDVALNGVRTVAPSRPAPSPS